MPQKNRNTCSEEESDESWKEGVEGKAEDEIMFFC